VVAGEGVQDAEVQERGARSDEDQVKHGRCSSARCEGAASRTNVQHASN
jgi:hypothetical protein